MSLKIRLRSLNRKVPQLEDIEGQRTTGFSNAAAYMRRYRGRIKADQECYVQYRAKETERVKEYRQTMSQEAKERTNETARLRMKKYRERKRLENIQEKVNAKSDRSMQTRSEKEKKSNQREKWRLYKQRYRAGLNSQKRRRIREKDAAAKRNKAHKRQLDNPEPPASTNTENVGNSTFPFPNARRKAISRARLSIPKTREKYAEVVAALVNKASPRKKDLLAKQGIGSPNAADQSNVLAAIQKTCGSLGKRQKRTFTMHLASSLKDSKYGLKRRTSQYLGLRWKYLMKYSSLAKKNVNIEAKKSRSDAISTDITAAVAEHYERAEVSTQMPNKKNIGKANAAKHVLQKTVKKTYQSFLEENPNMSVSFSKFASLRPKHVLVQKYAQHFQCLCEYCTNIDLKIKVINLQLVRHKIGLRLNDRYHTKDITTCGRTGKFPMLSCIDRKCNICGVQKLAEFLQPLTDVMGEHELTWQIWGKTSFKGTMRKALLRRTGSYGDLLQELQDELHPFACHLFEAIWQQRQFWSVIRSPPTLSVVIVMDFAENFSCITQNEVQSAHWTKMMVTLHPMVGYYKCHADGCSQGTVREAIHIVSEDMIHDTHAVTHFCKLACTHLKVERKVEFNRLIQFTDGCGAQYKSRTGFADISFGNIDFGVQVERHFFGSRHGKNPCDGEGGVVKNAVTRSVKSDVNVTIDGPREFYDFCSKNLAKAPVKPDGSCNHSRRTFYLVKEGDIQRERPTRTNVDTVAGTRKLHAVAGISPYLLHKRRLSCFCSPCQDLNSVAPCINLEFVKSWSECKMSAKGISFEATTSSNMEAADVGHTEMDEIPVCTLEPATDNATGATVGKSSSERSETGDLSEVGNAGGILTSNKVDYDESEVVQTQLDVLNEKVLKDLFCDVCLPENKHEALLKPQQRGIEIRLEEYYAVFYDNEFYIGRLLEKDGEEYLFKFLHRVCSASKMYDWPIRSDSEKVLGKFVIDGPLTLVGSGPFSVQEIENVEKTYAEMKAITQAEL